jgi:hypothetical protein
MSYVLIQTSIVIGRCWRKADIGRPAAPLSRG